MFVKYRQEKKTGKKVDLYGNEMVDEDVTNIDAHKKENKITLTNNDTKKTHSSSYKPSGKFIYDKDVLNKIQEIL